MTAELVSTVVPRGCDKARLVEVICTEALGGAGVPDDPVRRIVQYWEKDGTLIATVDTWKESMLRKEAMPWPP